MVTKAGGWAHICADSYQLLRAGDLGKIAADQSRRRLSQRDGMHFPTMSLVQVVALVENEARVDIEATVVVPKQS